MVDWQVTATTIYCEAVDDEVTLIVTPDSPVRCTGRQKYEKPSKDFSKALKRKVATTGKQLKCKGDDCVEVKQYFSKMLGEK